MDAKAMQSTLAENGIDTVITKDENPRTNLQNRSLHKWCEQCAEVLADAGIDMRELIQVPIKPNKDNFKSEIWHPVMKAINPKLESTTQMTTKETMEVYETLVRAFGEKKGITMPPWPSQEAQYYEAMGYGRD